MPTYHYVCEKCGHEFDYFQSMKDQPLQTCLKGSCGQKTWGKGRVHRELGTGAGIIFKGAGFYATDYRSPSYQKAAKEAASPGASGTPEKTGVNGKEAAAPAKSDVKPAAKPTAPGGK
jgi:putative FmdB family regulatory protein